MADAKSFEAGRRTIAQNLVNIMTVGEPGHEIRLNAETGGASGNSGMNLTVQINKPHPHRPV
jgi:hypothetical protein